MPNIDKGRIKRIFLLSVLLAGTTSSVWQIVHLYHFPDLRVGGYINPIPFAYMSFVYLLVVSFIFLERYKEKGLDNVGGILLVLVILLFLSIMITDTRGVWIALPFWLVAFVYFVLNCTKNKKLVVLSCLVVLVSSSPLVFQQVKDRYIETKSDYERISSGDYDGSIGVRLKLWSIAGDIISENPIFGVGEKGFYKIKNKTFRNRHTHAHNQYLDYLAKRGVISFLVFFAFITYPIVYGYRVKSKLEGKVLISVGFSYIIFGMTDTPFFSAYSLYIFLFVSYLMVIITGLDGKPNKKNGHGYN